MKIKEEHIVPLSRQAMNLLGQFKQISGDNELLFPGDHDATKVMSENTVNSALRAMGYDTKTEVCGHGFRTMARGAMGESGLWSDDAIERQLSHSERNNVRAAYIHTSGHLGIWASGRATVNGSVVCRLSRYQCDYGNNTF